MARENFTRKFRGRRGLLRNSIEEKNFSWNSKGGGAFGEIQQEELTS